MRFFAAAGALTVGVLIVLDDDETHHADVRRGREGETVELLDGCGASATATLRRTGKRWSAQVESVQTVAAPTPLVLALGAGDRDRFLSVAQDCSELGVTRLIPIETERSRQVGTRLRSAGVDKGRKRAREACKQSGNAWLPVIDEVTPLTALGQLDAGVRWFFGDPKGVPLGELGRAEPVGWLIGPEGGFTASEEEWMRQSLGATGVWFGPHILRFETAAVAAALLTMQLREIGRLSS